MNEPEDAPENAPVREPESNYVNGHRVEAASDSGKTRSGPLAYWADDPRPLAERFEALLRVIKDPDHYAARLAQRLYLWRGRAARRALFLHTLNALIPIANEAGLPDDDWQAFAQARPLMETLAPVFSGTACAGALCDSS